MNKVKNIVIYTILIATYLSAAEFKNHTFSIGFGDDKTGISLISYKYNIKKDSLNEYFIGAGTALLAFTGSVGWEHTYKKSKHWTSAIILSEQAIAHLGFTGLFTKISITSSIKLTNFLDFKMGFNAGIGVRIDEPKISPIAYPFSGFDFNF